MYKYYQDVLNIIEPMLSHSKKVTSDGSKRFYKENIMNFFNQYMSLPENELRPLNAITYYDINTYLNQIKYSDSYKNNAYSSLKKFFKYTYAKGMTAEITSQVTKPPLKKKAKITIEKPDYITLKNFILDKNNSIYDRLILGLFLFTGLSRQYVANLKNSQLLFEDGVYKLELFKNSKIIKLPIKTELQLIVNEYCSNICENQLNERIIKIDENYLSTYISDLTSKIVKKKYSPTIFSNTFISLSLANGNYIWEISNLILESVTVIAQHIDEDNEELFQKQASILNSF